MEQLRWDGGRCGCCIEAFCLEKGWGGAGSGRGLVRGSRAEGEGRRAVWALHRRVLWGVGIWRIGVRTGAWIIVLKPLLWAEVVICGGGGAGGDGGGDDRAGGRLG